MTKERQIEPNLTEDLNDKFRSLGVKAILTDFDDTLVDSLQLFLTRMYDFSEYLSKRSGKVDRPTLHADMSDTIHGLRPTYFVHPTLMSEGARIATLRAGQSLTDPGVVTAREKLMSIYEGTGIEALPGALETLTALSSTSAELVLATHGSQEFTQGKLGVTGFDRFFPPQNIFCFDNLRPKDARAWGGVLEAKQLKPNEVIVVGDNWRSDIAPVLELGVPAHQVFRVRTEYREANRNAIPGVREIWSIRDLPEAILEIETSPTI